MKGIILAGGKGTRLYPSTLAVSKQQLPIFNKPMIYYSLSTLLMSGIRDILLISSPEDLGSYERLLGNGVKWGIRIQYAVQMSPRGLADAFIVGADFLGDSDSVTLILGDNFMFGHDLSATIQDAVEENRFATIFAYEVKDPERYGIVELDDDGWPISIEEKPSKPKSALAVPGLYIYDHRVVEYAASLKPSARGEIEITDINKIYLHKKELSVVRLGRGIAWLDAGTHESLLQASNFVAAIEERQGLMIGCPEEIVYQQGWINRSHLLEIANGFKGNSYGDYLKRLADREI